MAVTSCELQVLCRMITTESQDELDKLAAFDVTYYSVFKEQAKFVLEHIAKYNQAPDAFTFQAQFPDITMVRVNESVQYLTQELNKNKQHIILLETFNKLKDLGSGDVGVAWQYLTQQCETAANLSQTEPMDIIHQAAERRDQIIEFNRQRRIPTGFDEIDKLMYGGLSTVEELLVMVARTNTGKSWVVTKMVESAQRHGFNSLIYSPEMQSSFLSTRFDTWRGHFQNNLLQLGKYSAAYLDYIESLQKAETPAYILEDKDVEGNEVTVPVLRALVKRLKIKLLVIDGLSYMVDVTSKNLPDPVKYKNLCADLFRLSKQLGCAVVVTMQANRDTQGNKDDKGEAFPTIYNIEGSDHPGRIATQVFAIRQIFEQHLLDIRLEKSRTASNTKPVLSYAWEVNTGHASYVPSNQDDAITNAITPPSVAAPTGGGIVAPTYSPGVEATTIEDADDIEF